MAPVLFQIAAGGALGAVARHLSNQFVIRLVGTGFPAGTVVVNVLGCFAMGVAFILLTNQAGSASKSLPFVLSGFLGGYTTMSAFSLDVWTLFNTGRLIEAFAYVVSTIILSLAAMAAGVVLARWIIG